MYSIRPYLASKVKAIVPDARGADELVPVNVSVQPPFKSKVV